MCCGHGVYVRVGSTNRRADRELIEELRRFARGESYDEQAMPELDSEALDFRAASELFAPVRKLKPANLETLRLSTGSRGPRPLAICFAGRTSSCIWLQPQTMPNSSGGCAKWNAPPFPLQ